jgi:hypothetical protein
MTSAPPRTKCPVPHEVDRFHNVVPLECCGVCGGTGFVDHEALLSSGRVTTKVDDFTVSLSLTESLGPIWLCECATFYRSKTRPPFCQHTIQASERVQALRGPST